VGWAGLILINQQGSIPDLSIIACISSWTVVIGLSHFFPLFYPIMVVILWVWERKTCPSCFYMFLLNLVGKVSAFVQSTCQKGPLHSLHLQGALFSVPGLTLKQCTLKNLGMVAPGRIWTPNLTSGYKWIQVDTSGYKWIQVDTSGYKWIQVDTSGYREEVVDIMP